jgi:uncharacterized membrane protein
MSHANLQVIQLILEVGIMVNIFFIFYISQLESAVINVVNLSFLGAYISTCICDDLLTNAWSAYANV